MRQAHNGCTLGEQGQGFQHDLQLASILLLQDPGNEQARHDGSIEAGGGLGQAMHLQQLFEALDQQLNFPARLVQADYLFARPFLGIQRAEKQQPAGKKERLCLHLSPMLLRLFATVLALRRRCLWGERASNDAYLHTLVLPVKSRLPLQDLCWLITQPRLDIQSRSLLIKQGNDEGAKRPVKSASCSTV